MEDDLLGRSKGIQREEGKDVWEEDRMMDSMGLESTKRRPGT